MLSKVLLQLMLPFGCTPAGSGEGALRQPVSGIDQMLSVSPIQCPMAIDTHGERNEDTAATATTTTTTATATATATARAAVMPVFSDIHMGITVAWYQLIAIVSHHWPHPQAGHYTTTTLIHNDQCWRCDDSRAAIHQPDVGNTLTSSESWLLFYSSL